MKKNVYFIAAAALIFAACSDKDFRNDINEPQPQSAISFESYTGKLTRAENSTAAYDVTFFNHHESFRVWSYKNTEATDPVFNGDTVTVTEKTAGQYLYTYSPLRYWDKAATTYQFYAAAPANGNWNFVPTEITSASTQNLGYFTTTSVLVGTNLALDPKTTLTKSFKDSTDLDKMIAAPCKVEKNFFSNPVNLNFIHILSKFNVSLRKDTLLKNQIVTLKKFEVKLLKDKGIFTEGHTAYADSAVGNNNRWVAEKEIGLIYASTDSFVVDTIPYYIVESLVIPQDAEYELVKLDGTTDEAKPYFEIEYTIWDGKEYHDAETFKATYNLANSFGMNGHPDSTEIKFNEGWQNTLNITLQPDVIEFTADVAEWATNLNDTLIIK